MKERMNRSIYSCFTVIKMFTHPAAKAMMYAIQHCLLVTIINSVVDSHAK